MPVWVPTHRFLSQLFLSVMRVQALISQPPVSELSFMTPVQVLKRLKPQKRQKMPVLVLSLST
jgi:hypothetical protein